MVAIIEFIQNYFWPIFIVLAVFIVIMIISNWKIFEKADIDGYKVLIPIYNLYLYLTIAELPLFFIPAFFVPFLGLIVFWITSYRIGKLFGKKIGFRIGLCVFPFVFYPILAFSYSLYKAEEEVGIIALKDRNTTMYNQFPEVSNQVEEIAPSHDATILMPVENENTTPVLNEEKLQTVEPFPPIIEDDAIENEQPALTPMEDDLILDVDHTDETWQNEKPLTEEEQTLKVVTVDPLKDDPLFNPNAKPIKVANLDQYKICPVCQTRLDLDAKVCFLCGSRIEDYEK